MCQAGRAFDAEAHLSPHTLGVLRSLPVKSIRIPAWIPSCGNSGLDPRYWCPRPAWRLRLRVRAPGLQLDLRVRCGRQPQASVAGGVHSKGGAGRCSGQEACSQGRGFGRCRACQSLSIPLPLLGHSYSLSHNNTEIRPTLPPYSGLLIFK
mgnify:CR=1 FL=1